MKALTLQQPWASLVADGSKKVETRGWHPLDNPRVLVICSSKKPCSRTSYETLEAVGADGLPSLDDLPRSAMLAVVTVERFERTETCHDLTRRERAFGDYRRGRWGWFFGDLVTLSTPIPLSRPEPGQKAQFRLGVWTLLPADEANLGRALGRDLFQRLKRVSDHVVQCPRRLGPPVVMVDMGENVGELLHLDQRRVVDLFDRAYQESPRRPLVERVSDLGQEGGEPGRVAERDMLEGAGDLEGAVGFLRAQGMVQSREGHEHMFSPEASR